MDIDASDLISQFRSMNTNDKDHLINEFRRLSKTEMTNEGCCFFLDLAEWNLNTALWTYYEYDASDAWNLPQMRLMGHVTVQESDTFTPNTKFTKTWRIINAGSKAWPSGCSLKLINGHDYGYRQSTYIDSLAVNEQTDLSVELVTPPSPGHYETQYRLFTPNNLPFGDPLWLVINVEENLVGSLTEQLSSVNMIGTENGAIGRANQNTIFSLPPHLSNNQQQPQQQQHGSFNQQQHNNHQQQQQHNTSFNSTTTSSSASSSPFPFSTSPSSSSLTSASSNTSNHNSLTTPTFRSPFTNFYHQQTNYQPPQNELEKQQQQQHHHQQQLESKQRLFQFNTEMKHGLVVNSEATNSSSAYDADDEKRPDFYDDMFS